MVISEGEHWRSNRGIVGRKATELEGQNVFQ